jgi:TRAP-type C4-dicarboxylate transport system substrate-binding protein
VRHGSVEANAIDAGRLGWQGRLKPRSPSWLNVLSEDKEETLLDSIAGQRGKSLRKASFMGYHLTNQGSSSNVTVALQDFWDRVADRTNGKLNMTVLPSDANLTGADNEALLGAANGRFDAVTANGPIYSGIIPQVANIMTLLFAYNNSQEGRKLVNRPVFQKALLKAGKPFDLRFLTKATLNSGMRDICTIPGHPINSAADLTGFKLRIPPSTAIEDQLKALDVVPLLTPISELDDVLISGEAYGEENPPSFIQTFNLKGITDQLSLTNHLWTGFLTAINLETWKSWPQQWRKIVLSEQKALQNQQWVPQDELNEQIIAEAPTTYDMTVVTPDMSAVLTDDDFIKTRNSVIRGLAPSLRPLARALVKGYRANR